MKTNNPKKEIFILIVSYLYIVLFVYASFSKILEFQDFQTQLGQSPLLGAYAIMVSYGVIILELTISLLLIFEKSRRVGLLAAYTLMVMFTTYILIILNFTSFTPCSCGGVLESLGWTEHLVFNLGFVLLAFIAVYEKPLLKRLLFLLFTGILLATILFLLSEKEIKQNNAFQRKYIPHALEEIGEYPLESNSFYLAGMDDQNIYLGNYNAPLYLKVIRRDLKKVQDVKIEIDNYDLPYKRVRIEVKKGYFFVGDGTVPVLFRGETKNWRAKVFSKNDAYFYQFQAMDSLSLIFTTTSTQTQTTVLGMLKKEKDSMNIRLQDKILKAQTLGKFDTDGILFWNSEKIQAAYVYYYRNQYEVTDNQLNFLFSGKTIDTISKAQLDVAYYKNEDSYKLGKATIVNRIAAVWENNLYINSTRLGKYESEEILKSASIIDRYNMEKNEYIYSFYLYHSPEQRLSEFRVAGDTIIGLAGSQLLMQKIKSEFYNE